MASLQDIRRRVKSVQSTSKITKAMEMVSAAKLRRAQARMMNLRPYADDMVEMMMDLATYAESTTSFTLLQTHAEVKTVGIVMMSGDRGLAGAFNANVLRKAVELDSKYTEQGIATCLMAVGKKGIGSLRFRGYELEKTWQGQGDKPAYTDAEDIARHVIDLYVSGKVDRVHLVSNHFKSPMEQVVIDSELLPIKREELIDEKRVRKPVSYIYEPGTTAIFESLLPKYIEIALYRALLESCASEQGARMTAMRSASENAEEMISSLTLALNRARQASITQEILEVISGADALG